MYYRFTSKNSTSRTSSNKKKRAMQVKKKRQRGLLDLEKVDAFSHFIETGGITYCKHEDSERILGNTFDMCILQDFEALTPNLIARTIETVAGGGLIILLLRSLFSLTSLKTMATDVHERFHTESYPQDSGRFNERFLLSLGSCKTCIVMDDELNILPISSHTKKIAPVSVREQLEEKNQLSSTSSVNDASGGLLKKTKLSESVRYASGDPIESWLHSLLCLDVINSVPSISRLPLPCECDLYHVNRDTLFSYHKDSKLFLQRMMALYVASHYKNSPDDLQLIADAPAHHLFVLLGPVDESKNHLPEICV